MVAAAATAAGPGHNRGPALQPAGGWHLHCWRRARADLLPHLPIEGVRLRVRRAGELGLDYKTYASVRAATGHDVVAFLFSSNAVRVMLPSIFSTHVITSGRYRTSQSSALTCTLL
jgi:hypothetical protein